MFDAEQGRLLLAIARQAIARELGVDTTASPGHPAWLDEPGASFVTLTREDALRGCIGSLEAHRPLGEDVAANARAAAFADPRFPALSRAEFPAIRVEVSVLSPAQTLSFRDEADLLTQLRPGKDGVILEYGWQQATFLPQVWEQLPDPRQFLAHLKRKAGLAADFFDPGLAVSRYAVEKFKEAPA